MPQNVYPDKPANSGVKNALLRAQQLLKLRWTPVAPYPAVYLSGVQGGPTFKGLLDPHRPQTGVGYSAVGYTNEKYVGLNVTIETYMTAMANPKSVLYTRSIQDRGRLSAAFYGTVCSGFASYVLGFPFHIDCPQFSKMEEMEHIPAPPLENLQLCDLLNKPTLHTAVITGIQRDDAGKVVSITVTESTPPRIISTEFLPEEFINFWLKGGYDVLRYKHLHTVTYTPDPWSPLADDPITAPPVPNSVLMPDYGNKANYRLGETVTLSVFDSTYTQILLRHNRQETVLSVDSTGDVCFTPEKSGYYEAVAIGPKKESQAVEFCVTEAAIFTQKESYQSGEPVKLTFSCPAGDELTGFMVKTAQSAKYWGYIAENGKLPDTVQLPAGDYYILAHYRNRFGVYSATPTHIFHIEENGYAGSAD